MSALPLFETETLKAIRKEREDLLKRLKRGGVDAHTRVKREEKLKILTARQIEIEHLLGLEGAMADDLVADLRQMLGDDGFFLLVEAHAGMRLYVPADPSRSDLSNTIGDLSANRLSKAYPGGYIKVPLARDFRALRYRESGLGNRDIARRLGLTETGVERLLKRAKRDNPGRGAKPKDTRQMDLF